MKPAPPSPAADSLIRVAAAVLRGSLSCAAVCFVLLYIIIAFSHLRFPFALEWIEGSVFDHVSAFLTDHD